MRECMGHPAGTNGVMGETTYCDGSCRPRRVGKGQRALERVKKQIEWLLEHGANEDGYVKRYGANSDPNKYGAGGPAIYDADLDALIRYCKQVPKSAMPIRR